MLSQPTALHAEDSLTRPLMEVNSSPVPATVPVTGNNKKRTLVFSSPSDTNYCVLFLPFIIFLSDTSSTDKIRLMESYRYYYYQNETAANIALLESSIVNLMAVRTIAHSFFLFLICVMLLAYPLRYRLYSNGMLEIDGIFRTFKFDEVQSARRNASILESCRKLRWDFATSIRNRVIIKRRSGNAGKCGGRAEVLCSPKDPDGLVEAIQKLVQVDDDDDDAAAIVV